MNRATVEIYTEIIREWKGELHEVAVMAEGYVYKGDVYTSLSPIGFRITGTKWSGPAKGSILRMDCMLASPSPFWV